MSKSAVVNALRKQILQRVPNATVTGTVGRRSSFEVTLNKKVIFSKLDSGSFPAFDKIAEQVDNAAQGREVETVTEVDKNHCAMFRDTLGVTQKFLRDKYNATDDEISYLNDLYDFQYKKRSSIPYPQMATGHPSLVLDEFLYHGDIQHASNAKLLKELKIKHIIDVCDCELDKEILENFNVLWINLNDDFTADIKKHFDVTNKFLYDCKQNKEKVLVHCQMGISRSSSIVLAYLMKYHHDTLQKAYGYLLERRRVAGPNPSFLLQLIRYEKELRATKDIDETKNNDDKQNPFEKLDVNQAAITTVSKTETEDVQME
ncbi:hypothetical protein I4U23_009831 [Adineta vaga]|nr:hypothetical protein I4U23_009831 [Adineta vaga]